MCAAPSALSTPAEINLGAEIYHSIASTSSEQNVIISPLLLESTLALLFLGSDGATAEELQRLLQLKHRFPSNAKMANYYASQLANATADADTRLQLQNHLLLQPNPSAVPNAASIADDFQKIAQTYFHATAECVDMQQAEKLRRHINEYILAAVAATGAGNANANGNGNDSSSDNWQLPQLLGNSNAQLLLVLAARLQSKWFLPFSAYRTGLYEFHGGENASNISSVPMLFDDDMFVKYAELRELNARAIELPYEHASAELAMLLILPNQRDGLTQLEQQLRLADLGALQQRMQMESVQVLLPKFTIHFQCSLRQALKQFGFVEFFAKSANFKHLHGQGALPVLDVLHQLRIAVHESGSESTRPAAAYKPIVISNSSRQKFFRADHPFFFAIRAENVTLFMGHVVIF